MDSGYILKESQQDLLLDVMWGVGEGERSQADSGTLGTWKGEWPLTEKGKTSGRAGYFFGGGSFWGASEKMGYEELSLGYVKSAMPFRHLRGDIKSHSDL